MISPKILISLPLLVLLAACQTTQKGNSSPFTGGLTQKSAVDGLKGGPLSQSLGEGLSASAMSQALNAELTALETGLTGSATTWEDKSGVSGRVVPGQVYEVGESKCRRYKHQIVVNGKTRNGEGTACKGENGLWAALN